MPNENNLANRHTVASYFARTHLHNGVLLGGNEKQFLHRANITSTQLEQQKARVTPTQLASIVKSCWQVSGDELLGFTQQKMKVGMFSLLAERLITCKTLDDAFICAASFYSITGDQLQFTVEKNSTLVRLSINANFQAKQNLASPNSLLNELLLLICHRFFSWLVGQVIPLRTVYMQHTKPSHHDEYRLMYPCPCEYQSINNTLVLDSQYLNLPVVQNNDDLAQYLKQIPLQWFKKQNYYDTCSAQVLRILEYSTLQKDANLPYVAAKLNMTSRTLRRKLIAEGSGFQQLKDNTRRDKAINLFEQTHLSIAQIGLALGYTELATFSRAFKHWTGVSPSTYRNYRALGN